MRVVLPDLHGRQKMDKGALVNMRTNIAIIVMAMSIVGAVSIQAAPVKEKSAAAPAKKSSTAAEPAGSGNLNGKVVETMDAGGYTYVCLEKKGKRTWLAVPQMKVAMGSTMSFQPGSVMPNFSSPSLKRTFDTIIFSPGPVSGGAAEMPASHPPIPSGATGSKASVSSKDATIKVAKAQGANAYTVGEVHAKRSSLNKKTVQVRGKVVKVNRGIMDRNWVHIQDGSGDQTKGTHNLVATSQETPAVDDVVTVTGTVAKDRDFGGGYTYNVIIENAAFAK